MNIGVLGLGYVGLTTACGFAEMGHDLVGLDTCPEKMRLLPDGQPSFFEPGLKDLLQSNILKKRLSFTKDLQALANHAEVIFVCVGTPNKENNKVNLDSLCQAVKDLGALVRSPTTLVIKSTLPLGGCELLQKCASESDNNNYLKLYYNPEFLKQGSAISDFMKPDRIVIGSVDGKGSPPLEKIYSSFVRNGHPILHMDYASAELTKYAANAMLATRISFMNELAEVSEKIGADILSVRSGLATDKRIGPDFLHAGLGFGGSCLPKDTKALIKSGRELGLQMPLISAVNEVNESRVESFIEKIRHHFSGNLLNKKIAVWGLAFKPETDDLREAPAVKIINKLTHMDIAVIAYDPRAMKKCREIFADNKLVSFASSAHEALKNCSGLVVATECFEFREPKLEQIKNLMSEPTVFDGRNLYKPDNMKRNGINYYSIGR